MKIFTILLLITILFYQSQSQMLHVFDVDTTNFPIMKAKLYASDDDNKLRNDLNLDNFQVSENDNQCNVLRLNNSLESTNTDVSSLLTIDISNSMVGNNIELAKEFSKAWIENLDVRKSECAIATFNTEFQILQDFTKDKERLNERLSLITCKRVTFIGSALRHLIQGDFFRLPAKEDLKKVIIIITDDEMNLTPEYNYGSIANTNDVTIYCVNIGRNRSTILEDIVEKSGGLYFDNINSIEDAKNTALLIKYFSQNVQASEIEWEGKINCSNDIPVDLDIVLDDSISNKVEFVAPNSSISYLHFLPKRIDFINSTIGKKSLKKVKVTAMNTPFELNKIVVDNPLFKISPSQFSLSVGESIELTIEYTPLDSSYVHSSLKFLSSECSQKFDIVAYYDSNPFLNKKISITSPNGGEVLTAGENTLITWDGVPPSDLVEIDISTDDGKNWKQIASAAKNNNYNWNVKTTTSDSCLVKVRTTNLISQCIGRSGDDKFNSIVETSDGYLVSGSSHSLDTEVPDYEEYKDFYISKLDKNLEFMWSKSYGGSSQEYLHKVIKTGDAGFLLVGTTQSNDGDVIGFHGQWDADIWVVKIDSVGNLIWQKCLGGSKEERLFDVISLSDGLLLVGETFSGDGDVTGYHESEAANNSDLWVVKLDYQGKIGWDRAFGGSHHEYVRDIKMLDANSIIIASQTVSTDGDITSSNGGEDTWIFRLDSLGNIAWQRSVGGNYTDHAVNMKQTKDNGFFLYGYSNSNDGTFPNYKGEEDATVIKLDAKGEIKWAKSFGGSLIDLFIRGYETHDGNYILLGLTESVDGDVSDQTEGYKQWICKIDSSGKLLWEKCRGDNPSDHIYNCIIQDDGYVLFGQKYETDNGTPKWWTQKLDKKGQILYENISDEIEVARVIVNKDDDGTLYLQGVKSIADKDNLRGFWIANTDKDLNILWEKEFQSGQGDQFLHSYIDSQNNLLAVLNVKSSNELFEEHHGLEDIGIVKLKKHKDLISQDVSDDIFSIDKPKLEYNEIVFGALSYNANKDTLVTSVLKNIGSKDVLINSIYLYHEASVFGIYGVKENVVLESGSSLALEININPFYNKVGWETTYIAIEMLYDTLYVPLKVKVINNGKPLLASNQAFYFDTLPIHVIQDTLINRLFYNNVDETINIEKIEFTGYDKDQFEFIDSSRIKPFALDAMNEYDLEFRYKPNKIGRMNAQMAVYHDGDGSPLIFRLYGEGIGNEIYASDDSARPNELIDININYNGVVGGRFADLVASCEGVLRVDSRILEPLNPDDLISTKDGFSYIRFAGAINPSEKLICKVPLRAKDHDFLDSTYMDIDFITWYDTNGEVVEYDTEYTCGLFRLLEPSGISDKSHHLDFNVYPNPASDYIEISSSVSSFRDVEISLISMLGETVAIFDTNSTSIMTKHDISNIAPGNYVLQLKNSEITIRRKVMIIR